MRSESDEKNAVTIVRPFAMLFPDELASIRELANTHVGVSRIANVGVVFPNDDLCARTATREQVIEGLRHLALANVPRFTEIAAQRPIKSLSVAAQRRFVLMVEGLAH